ncbi:hypothetical protein [Teredinibacter haidensis]|uniref:hypothetical protein n=1 Tax=Teredinibacter haidensis TaxID=2731755 RepID=UPI000948A2E8|nr:hypothetical protein [Teredinibacter haidensis]
MNWQLISLIGILYVMPAVAINEERLWLPAKYHKYYLDLKESAQAAENLDICVEVLRGTLDFEQSSKNRPIFRIQCRREDGLSYNEMVDGVSKETLTHKAPTEGPLSVKEVERLRMLEEKRKQDYRESCLDEFQKQTIFMLGLQLHTPEQANPLEFNDDSAVFIMEFDAKNIAGTPLKYRATCRVGTDKSAEVVIKPRK